ncbi:MAG: hypothetical protein ACD_56C00146G0017 [uncultured bacterium]|nr:MAG: hypothetical protein ACD_56C00146G0017 [uncultured bacterium]
MRDYDFQSIALDFASTSVNVVCRKCKKVIDQVCEVFLDLVTKNVIAGKENR